MRRILALGLALVPLLSTPATAGPETDRLDRLALVAKSRGRYLEARRLAGRALATLLEKEWTGSAADRGHLGYLLHLHHNLAARTGDTLEGLADLDRARALAGEVGQRAAVDLFRLRLLARTPRVEEARRLAERLGFLRDWYLVGPFGNDRGQGFNQPLPPEEKIDLEATYRGKRAPVQWRRLEARNRADGTLDLGAVLRPQEQVLAYGVTAVSVPRAVTAVLRAGSSGSVRVWVGGRKVLDRDVHRPFRFDQDEVVVHLRKGANRVRFKAGVQEGSFLLALRLTGTDGAPLDGLACRPLKPLLTRTPQPAPGTAATFAPGAVGALTALNGRSPSPANAFRLAFVLTQVVPFDENDRQDRRWAAKAVAGDSKNPIYRYLHAHTLTRNEGVAAEKDENARRRALEETVRLDPDYAEAHLSLAVYYKNGQDNDHQALRRVRRALQVNPDHIQAGLFLASLLEGYEGEAESHRLLRRLHATPEGRLHRRLTLAVANEAINRARMAEALTQLQELLQRAYRPALVATIARLLVTTNRRAEALDLLERAGSHFPFSRTLPRTHADLLAARGDLAGAARELEGILAFCPDDDAVMVKLAELAGQGGRRSALVDWYRRALAANPSLDRVKRHLEFLRSDEKTFYADLAIDTASVINPRPPLPPDAREKNDSHDYLLKHKVVKVNRDGTSHIYEHLVVRILTEAGAERFQTFSRAYFGGEQSGRILAARVIHPNNTESRARLDRFMSGFGSTANIYVKMPPIRPGDIVDIRFRIDELRPSIFGTYFGHQHIFSVPGSARVNRSRFDLLSPADRPLNTHAKNGAPRPVERKLAGGLTLRTWQIEDVPRVRREASMPNAKEHCPTVEVSTYANWDQFGTWWWNLIRRQYDTSAEMDAKVAELTRGLKGETAKIRAIYDFVVTDVRYVAWEFGVHGYKPYNASTILSRRHGDCKDKAILLGAMLDKVGIKAWPVLIHADNRRSRDDLTLPLVNHFNHCIAYVPKTGDWPGGFLDGTATYHPADIVPDMDRGAQVVVVMGGRTRLLQVPWSDPAANVDRREIRVDLTPAGDATVVYTATPTGNQAVYPRMEHANEPGKRREKLEKELAPLFGKVRITDLEFSDLLDLDQPVRYRARMEVKEFAERRGRSLVLKACLDPAEWVSITPMESRIHDLLLLDPWTDHYTLRYILPPGWDTGPLPPDQSGGNEVAAFSVRWRRQGREITVEVRRTIKRQRITRELYQAFRNLTGKLDTAESQVILVAPAGREER